MLTPNAVQPPSQVLELLPSQDQPTIAGPARAARLGHGLLRAGALLLQAISEAAAMAFVMPPAGSFPHSGSARSREPGFPDSTTDERVAATLTAVGCRGESALTVVGRYAPVPASRAFAELLAEHGAEDAARPTRRVRDQLGE